MFLVSAATPMTSYLNVDFSPSAPRWRPSGFCDGKYCFANASLMITTLGAPAASRGENSRLWTRRILVVEKKTGPTTLNPAICSFSSGCPATQTDLKCPHDPNAKSLTTTVGNSDGHVRR